MPRNATILTVFLASPSDVAAERDAVNEVVEELNRTWGRSINVFLEVVRWETHVAPGVAEDAQAVINKQIGDDYDIFVGVLWKRFGTPTGRADSGTEEEFNRAYLRHEKQKMLA